MPTAKTRCPGCGVQLKSGTGFAAGESIRCPRCGRSFTVPPPAGKAAPASAGGRGRPAPRASRDEGSPQSPGLLVPALLLAFLIGGTWVFCYLHYGLKPDREVDTTAVPAPEPTPLPVAAVALPPKGDATGFGALLAGAGPPDTGPALVPLPHTPTPDLPVAVAPPPRSVLAVAPAPAAVPAVALAPAPRPPSPRPLPRRLLFVHVSRYIFLNPLAGPPAGKPDWTRAAALALAGGLGIPAGADGQTFLLSDTAPPPDGRPLVKEVVEVAFRRFAETTRRQDRVVVYFGGHALERGGKAYFAPADGDADDEASLIPVAELYAGLGKCDAAQRVVIWDVCRRDPRQPRRGPGDEPMSEALHAALTAAPPGVQVVVTCGPGENAMEFSSAPADATGKASYSGSLFLEAVRPLAGKPPGGRPVPGEPIPVAGWAREVNRRVAELAGLAAGAGPPPAQTVGVAGRARDDPAAYDSSEPPARRFALPDPPEWAPAPEVAALVREFAVPPVRAGAGGAGLADIPYRADVLKRYAPDISIEEILKDREKYPFRAAVVETLGEVRGLWAGGAGGLRARASVPAPVTNALKKQLRDEQDVWAVGIAQLERLNLRLDELEKERAAQPPRWQAHYDYARAVVKSRLAYMSEYNLALGNVFTDTLPDLDAKLGQTAYALVPVETEKMRSKKDVRQLAADAAELFDKLAAERKGTPWAVQARRDRAVPLGLSWQPAAPKAARPGP